MTLDLDNMTQAEFDKRMAEIKAKRPNLERENQQTIETPSESLSPDYGRYIQLAGVRVYGGMK